MAHVQGVLQRSIEALSERVLIGAAPRIHDRKKRQVLAMCQKERPHLWPLPAKRFRIFRQQTRTVDDAVCVQVDCSYYAASPAPLYSETTVRIYEHKIEILGKDGQVLHRHNKRTRRGEYALLEEDCIFDPSRETAQLIGKVAKIGPHSARLAREIFVRPGRPGQKPIYGMANLPRRHKRADMELACEKVLQQSRPSIRLSSGFDITARASAFSSDTQTPAYATYRFQLSAPPESSTRAEADNHCTTGKTPPVLLVMHDRATYVASFGEVREPEGSAGPSPTCCRCAAREPQESA